MRVEAAVVDIIAQLRIGYMSLPEHKHVISIQEQQKYTDHY